MRLLRFAFALAILAPLAPLGGQAEQALKRGVKVRITTPTRTEIGYVDTLTAEALSVHQRGRHGGLGPVHTYRRDFLKTVDVARSRGSGPTLVGGLLGMLAGGAIGFATGAALYSDEDCDILACSPEEAGGFMAIWGVLIGVPVGMVVGSMRSPRWEQVQLMSR